MILFKNEHKNGQKSSKPGKKFNQQLQLFWASIKMNRVLCDKRNL